MNPSFAHRRIGRHGDVDPRFAEWRATGDIRIRNALVEDTSWLASFCARRFAHRGESREDLAQVALVGLVNAVSRFDPGRGLSFSTFAVPTIEGELRRHFRDRTWAVHVSRRVKDNARIAGSAVEDLTASLGRTPTVEEIATRTVLHPDEVREALEAHAVHRGVALDDGDDDDVRQSSHLGVVERGYEAAEARAVVAELLAALPTPRDNRIVEMRFVEGLSQSEIAREVGVSQAQVSRLLRTNLEHMHRAASWRTRRAVPL